MRIYESLLERFGPQHWWPADSPFEVMVGAVLTQNTNWTNVEKAIEALKSAGCLEPLAMLGLPPEELSRLIQPSGYFRIKERRLRSLVRWFVDRYDADLNRLERVATEALRQELLAVHGVGPETADSILLYALDRPQFVVDAYTHRILQRHGWLQGGESYDAVQQMMTSHLKPDVALYNEYHALIVRLGKEHCRPKPLCAGCVLEACPGFAMLPDPE
jgi:endonuclease-3 related protein